MSARFFGQEKPIAYRGGRAGKGLAYRWYDPDKKVLGKRMEDLLQRLLFGPSANPDGRVNLIGALRRSMATTGYSDLKEFQRVEVVVAPYAQG